ncbi:MAG: phenylalanine 4-monooxygenase, partial [Sphingopyxis sp.]
LWLYTVEFGLVVEDGELRAFGGGLMSSFAETLSALTAPEPKRIWLDIERVMRTKYHFDQLQQTYFVVAGFGDLLRATEETDFASVYGKIAGEPALEPGDAYRGDLAYEGRRPAVPANGEASR